MADYSKIYDIKNGPVKTATGGEADDVDTLTVRAQWAFQSELAHIKKPAAKVAGFFMPCFYVFKFIDA